MSIKDETEKFVWDDWPECPQCGLARQAACPNCGIAGTEFPLAEYQAAGAPTRKTRPSEIQNDDATPAESSHTLLLCPACDETFQPRFYRQCADCGFDFEEGLTPASDDVEEVPNRALAVAAVLALLAVAVMAYFWWVLAF